jgi:hypothetical protein
MLFMLCFEAADSRRTLAACVSLGSSQPSYEPLSLVHPAIAFFSTTELDVMAIENTNNTFQSPHCLPVAVLTKDAIQHP